MAAVDIYVNETTRHADVILPPTTALERDHYDLVFHLLAVRNTARFTPAVLAPEPGALHDWQIYRELARRTTQRLAARPGAAQAADPAGPALGQPDRADRPAAAPRRLRRHDAAAARAPRRASTSARCAPASCPSGSRTADHRVRPRRRLVLDDLDRLALDADAPGADELVLIGRRHQRDCNSWMHNTERLTRGRPRHQLLMHPDDLAERGLADGALVSVSSRVGAVAGRGAGERRPDAGRRLACPTATATGSPAPGMSRAAEVAGRLDQRPHRPRPARRVGQRRAQRACRSPSRGT